MSHLFVGNKKIDYLCNKFLTKTMRLKTILTIINCCFALTCAAQLGKFFNPDRQLSSSFVTQVYQDREGYLWITTRDGINRYDGYQFQVFRRENEGSKTLASNYVNTMIQDRHGLFYFGMYGALQTWDGGQFNTVSMTDLKHGQDTCQSDRWCLGRPAYRQ